MTKKLDIKKLSTMAVMLAVTLFLDISPFGAIPIGTISATIVQIPTIITAILLGPVYGMAMGGLFGVISLIHAATRPMTPLDPLFVNPLISVFPRIMIGLFAALAFIFVNKLLKDKAKIISASVAGAVGAMTNTVFVMGMLYFIYAESIINGLGLDGINGLKAVIIAVVTTNGFMEAAVCFVISGAVIAAHGRLKR